MSKCRLDIDEPKLVIIGSPPAADLRAGLEVLRDKVAQNHKASNWFSHPMSPFNQYSGKVWEWDFKPAHDTSLTRPGYRLFAYVPEPNGTEPILARPFLGWDKDKAPKGKAAKVIAQYLREFLAKKVKIKVQDATFRDQFFDGVHIGLCLACYAKVESADFDEYEVLKDTHTQECTGEPEF